MTTVRNEIRREASPIFYTVNRFKLLVGLLSEGGYVGTIEARGKAFLSRWTNSIGQDNVQSLRHLEVDIGVWERPRGRDTLHLVELIRGSIKMLRSAFPNPATDLKLRMTAGWDYVVLEWYDNVEFAVSLKTLGSMEAILWSIQAEQEQKAHDLTEQNPGAHIEGPRATRFVGAIFDSLRAAFGCDGQSQQHHDGGR
ncbi:hypothetical protein LTR37_003129 [Vermiconidia calcicola]|uniref:Uncharacterized protein n=1 Tax=Vermiconidia calcicola TaxID=1690605 RepID=A0ACC3NSD1_9PEZI|nr:hypothetical protein LTR37_003129 [Vermiconidia calcicola]